MALSFRRNGNGTFNITISERDREILSFLIPQVTDLIEAGDELTWRLFPNPHPDDDQAADNYRDLTGDELTRHHLNALNTMLNTLSSQVLSEEQLESWMFSLNHIRLVLGSRLDIDSESEIEDFSDAEEPIFATFSYCGFVLEHIVEALSGATDSVFDEDIVEEFFQRTESHSGQEQADTDHSDTDRSDTDH